MSTTQNNSLLKNLIDFGLSDKEAKVYLALLELGETTANNIAEKSGLNRSSTYIILESLEKSGFIDESRDKKIREYKAVSPDTLLEMAKKRVDKTRNIMEEMEEMVPNLKNIHKGSKKAPTVRVFEGKEAMKDFYYDVFKPGIKELRVFEDFADIHNRFSDFFLDYEQRRANKNIMVYTIAPDREETISFADYGASVHLEKIFYIPKDKYRLPADITIYGDKVSFGVPGKYLGIIIEHKEIAESLKNAFDLAFEEAKRLDKERQSKDKKKGK